MRKTVAIDVAEITPDVAAVRRSLGYDRGILPDARIAALMDTALAQFAAHAAWGRTSRRHPWRRSTPGRNTWP